MKALILAAGRGKRLQPLTNYIAKHLIPVANKPIIHFGIEQIKEAGIKDIGIVVSPDSASGIEISLGNGSKWGAIISYVIQEKPLGLAHAVLSAKEYIGDSPFLLFLGDNLIQEGVKDVVKKFNRMDCDAVIVLKKVQNPEAFGVAEITPSGCVVKLLEKPQYPVSDLALVGAYAFKPIIFDAISRIKPSERGEYEITDAIQQLVDMGLAVETHQIKGWWLDTGTREDLLKANQILCKTIIKRSIKGSVDEQSRIEGEVEIGRGAFIKNSVISGPVSIGDEAQVIDSHIRPYTCIAGKTVIDHSAIKKTIILDNAEIKNVTAISDSIIGSGTRIYGKGKARYSGRIIAGDK